MFYCTLQKSIRSHRSAERSAQHRNWNWMKNEKCLVKETKNKTWCNQVSLTSYFHSDITAFLSDAMHRTTTLRFQQSRTSFWNVFPGEPCLKIHMSCSSLKHKKRNKNWFKCILRFQTLELQHLSLQSICTFACISFDILLTIRTCFCFKQKLIHHKMTKVLANEKTKTKQQKKHKRMRTCGIYSFSVFDLFVVKCERKHIKRGATAHRLNLSALRGAFDWDPSFPFGLFISTSNIVYDVFI